MLARIPAWRVGLDPMLELAYRIYSIATNDTILAFFFFFLCEESRTCWLLGVSHAS